MGMGCLLRVNKGNSAARNVLSGIIVLLTVFTVVVPLPYLPSLPVPPAAADDPVVLVVDASDASCDDLTVDSSVIPYCTIQAAIDDSGPADEIQIHPGTMYVERLTIPTFGISLIGAGTVKPIVDGGTLVPGVALITIASGIDVVHIENLEIRNGTNDILAGTQPHPPSSGGGIVSEADLLSLDNVSIHHNAVMDGFGGGVAVFGGELSVVDSTIDANDANSGGGIYLEDHGTVTIDDSTISQNAINTGAAVQANGIAGRGAGLDATSPSGPVTPPTITITDSVFSNNAPDTGSDVGNGGGLNVLDAELSIMGGHIIDNLAASGGGLGYSGPDLHIDGTRFAGNEAGGHTVRW